jgi:ComF family protein
MIRTVTRLGRAGQFFAETMTEIVFPPRCASCGHRGVWVCEECLPGVTLIEQVGCERCGVTRGSQCVCDEIEPGLDMIRAAAIYDAWLRTAIHHFKYDGEYARYRHLADLMMAPLARFGVDITLVPVPLHRKREMRRGYNQAALLARELGTRAGVQVEPMLERVIETHQQVGLSAADRALNVRNAFAATAGARCAGERVVLIDDVFTTGATLGACAMALKHAGASWVGALTIARES